MSTTTIRNLDKIKMLDQMLEDLAGEEFEDYDADNNGAGASLKHHDIAEDIDEMEVYH